jgi:hypothetical protein
MKHSKLFSELLILFRGLLSSEDFLEEFRVPNHFVRKGKLSMESMVLFLLFHSKSSLDNKMDQFRDKFPSLHFPFVSKQALSKARYGIKHELFQTLFETTADFYYENIPDRKKWLNKYHLFAIDGSTQEVPSSESTFAEFGKQSDQKNPTLFWSKALASVLYDVLDDMIVDAVIEKQFSSERELSLRHLARFTDVGLQENSIVIFDRGYYSKDLFRDWVDAGCKVLMRIRQPNNLCKLKGKDVKTKICYSDGVEITGRVLKYTLSTGEIEYLITNAMDNDITSEMFGELYFNRWKVESKYLEIKEQWKIEEFTGTRVLAVRQDFYITMMHVNLAAIIKLQADELIAKESNPANKYKYKARKSYIIGKIYLHFLKWVLTSFTQEDVEQVIVESSKKRSQVKPGRTNKRKRSTRARKHYNNRKNPF